MRESYDPQKHKRGAPELITLLDIFVFVLRHNRWYLCEVIMGYEFLKGFKISKIVPSHCFQAWNNWFLPCVPVITPYFIRYETRAKYTVSVQIFSLNISAICHKKA